MNVFNKSLLEKLLSFNDEKLPETLFNPLLLPGATRNISRSLLKILETTSNSKGFPLKEKVRKSAIEMIRMLTKTSSPYNTLAHTSRSDIFLKHLRLRVQNGAVRQSKFYYDEKIKVALYDKLDEYGYEYLNMVDIDRKSVPAFDLDLGIALINLRSDTSKSVLNSIVKNCIENFDENNAKMEEFLKTVWENGVLVISPNLFDILSLKLMYLIEIKFLDIATVLIAEFDTIDVNFRDKLDSLITSKFINNDLFMKRLCESSLLFYNVFKLLMDIFIKSNYEKVIEEMIRYLYSEVKLVSGSDNIMRLYPYHLNTVVLLLDNNVDIMKKNQKIYDYILGLIHELKMKSQTDFIFVMMQHTEWLFAYLEDGKSLECK